MSEKGNDYSERGRLHGLISYDLLMQLGERQSKLRYAKKEYLLEGFRSEGALFKNVSCVGTSKIELDGEIVQETKSELLSLLDPLSTKLIQHNENYSHNQRLGKLRAQKAAETLSHAGLVSRVTEHPANPEQLRLIAKGHKKKYDPSSNFLYYELTSSMHRYALNYWIDNGLRWYPVRGKLIRSGLMLGFSLPEIIWYYENRGVRLDSKELKEEVRDYISFVDKFVERLEKESKSSVVPP